MLFRHLVSAQLLIVLSCSVDCVAELRIGVIADQQHIGLWNRIAANDADKKVIALNGSAWTDDEAFPVLTPESVRQFANLADLLVVPDMQRDGKVLGATFWDSKSGSLLNDCSATEEQTQEEILGSALQKAIRKISDTNHTTIRLVAGKSLIEDQPTTDAVTEALARQLCRADQAVVLLNQDQRSSVTESQKDTTTLTVTITRAGKGISASLAVINDESSDLTYTATAETANLEIVNRLAEQAFEHFDWAPEEATPDDPKTWSTRFAGLSDALFERDLFLPSFRQAELSLLSDHSYEARQMFADRMGKFLERTRYRKPKLDGRIFRTLVAKTISLQATIAETLSADNPKTLIHHLKWPDVYSRGHRLILLFGFITPSLDFDDSQRLNEQLHYALLSPISAIREAAANSRDAKEAYSRAIAAVDSSFRRLNRNESPAIALTLVTDWLDWFDEQPANQRDPMKLNRALDEFTIHAYPLDSKITEPFHDRLLQHKDGYVRMIGLRGKIVTRWLTDGSDASQQTAQFAEVRDAALKLFDESEEQKIPGVRRAVVDFLDHSYNYLRLRREPMSLQMIETAKMLQERGIFAERIILDGARGVGTEESATVAHEFLTKLAKQRSAGSRFSRDATKILKKMEHKWPSLQSAQQDVPITFTRLLDRQKPGRRPLLVHPRVHNNELIVLDLDDASGGTWIQCLAIPLDGGEVRFLGEYAIPESYGSIYMGLHYFVTTACLDNNNLVAAMGNGREGANCEIVRFSLDRPTTDVMLPRGVLPNGIVQSLAVANGELFCGMKEGSLIRVSGFSKTVASDANTLVPKVIASSNGNLATSPLDKFKEFSVPLLISDPAQQRILAFVKLGQSERYRTSAWQFELETGELSLLREFERGNFSQNHLLKDDVLTLSGTGVTRWNLKENVVRNLPDSIQPTAPALCNGKLFSVQTDGAINSTDAISRKTEVFYPGQISGKPHDSSDRSYVIPVDDNRFLVYFAQQIWLATPDK